MLNEPGGSSDLAILREASPAHDLQARLRAAVEEVFFIEVENDNLPEPVTASYTGRLTMDSAAAYDQLDAAFKPLDHFPIFTVENQRHVIRAMCGRFKPAPRPWWPNVALLVATILSLLYTGATQELQRIDLVSPLELLKGLPYAIALLLILGTHELGHYFAARRHKVAVTLPYFIPLPLPGSFGTMGAFIQLREPMRNRRVLLDIGAAGPLAGLIVAIPVLLIGLRTSPVLPSPVLDVFMLKSTSASYVLEGNSILYALAKILVFGHFLPDGMRDVYINQVAQAGWTGLLVTALNLVPIGQLDGGHTLYSLIGERARLVYLPLLALLGVLTLISGSWLLWVILLLMFGRVYATPLDSITRLDTRRRVIAIVTLLVFILVFMPIPLQQFSVGQ
ncbi:MAG: site-2 protease family protein [Anaerolineae bacterium]|nr:site-2 protease family protein [Anaerolineae bacterium]